MPPTERQCPICGDPFVSRWERQIYCCRRHQNSANWRRRFERKPRQQVWTAEMDRRLTEMIEAGHSRAAIGRMLGMTRNAVIGRAHRIGLAEPKNAPPLSHTQNPFPGPRECRYPIGHPGEPGFHFCAAPIDPGSPYCPTHHNLCYVRTPALPEAA